MFLSDLAIRSLRLLQRIKIKQQWQVKWSNIRWKSRL